MKHFQNGAPFKSFVLRTPEELLCGAALRVRVRAAMEGRREGRIPVFFLASVAARRSR